MEDKAMCSHSEMDRLMDKDRFSMVGQRVSL